MDFSTSGITQKRLLGYINTLRIPGCENSPAGAEKLRKAFDTGTEIVL
jgi:hypothetical protein